MSRLRQVRSALSQSQPASAADLGAEEVANALGDFLGSWCKLRNELGRGIAVPDADDAVEGLLEVLRAQIGPLGSLTPYELACGPALLVSDVVEAELPVQQVQDEPLPARLAVSVHKVWVPVPELPAFGLLTLTIGTARLDEHAEHAQLALQVANGLSWILPA